MGVLLCTYYLKYNYYATIRFLKTDSTFGSNCESRHLLDWLGRSNQDGEEAIEVQSPSSSSFTSLSSSRASTLIGGRVTAVADWAGGVLVNQLLNKRLNIIIVIKIIVAIIVVVVLIAVVVLVVVVVIIIVNTINPKLSSPSSSS